MNTRIELDTIDTCIVQELGYNARISLTDLGRRVGLSASSVTERVRRLEATGVILGYRAQISPQSLGHDLEAYVRLGVTGEKCKMAAQHLQSRAEVLECHRVTGDDSFIARVAVRSVGELESFLDSLMPYGRVTTSIVLSTAVAARAVAGLGTVAAHDTQRPVRKASVKL